MNDLKNAFGGSTLSGNRKTARPLSTKRPIHFIVKTSGFRFFTPGNRAIENLIRRHASKYKIKIYRLSLNWTHFHMILQIPSRLAYVSFVRTLNAAIVRAACMFKKLHLKGIFDLRPYKRILGWRHDFANVMAYHDLNDLEARGYIRRKKKKHRSKKRIRPCATSKVQVGKTCQRIWPSFSGDVGFEPSPPLIGMPSPHQGCEHSAPAPHAS